MGKRLLVAALIVMTLAAPVTAQTADDCAPAQGEDGTYFCETTDDIYRTFLYLAGRNDPDFRISCPLEAISGQNSLTAVYKQALASDAGFIRWNVLNGAGSYSARDGVAQLRYMLSYRMTGDETAKSLEFAKDVVSGFDLTGLDDAGKMDLIREYVIQNWTYDETLQNNTPYAIFSNKTGACLGYALGVFLLCKEAGLQARTIHGYLDEGLLHIWLIVKLGGEWYTLETTEMRGGFYLNNAHPCTPMDEYLAESFTSKYPLAGAPYGVATSN